MSNYHREWFPGYQGQVCVGAEDVNGTGQVQITFDDGPDGVTLYLPHETARKFAAFIIAKADEAQAAASEALSCRAGT